MQAGEGNADEAIEDDAEYYRMVWKRHIRFDTDPPKPGSGDFQDSSDGSGMSVIAKADLDAASLTWRHIEPALFPDQLGQRVPCILTGKVLKVYRQVIRKVEIPELPGHYEVFDSAGRRSGGTSTKLKRASFWPPDAVIPNDLMPPE